MRPLWHQRIARRRHLTQLQLNGGRLSLCLEFGEIQRVARGLYVDGYAQTWIKGPEPYLQVRLPAAVLCLESALYVHKLLERRPVPAWVAIGRNARRPKIPELALRFVRFTRPMLEEGVITGEIDGFPVNVTCIAKTICDCLRYRSKIAPGVAEAALAKVLAAGCPVSELRDFAAICEVEQELELLLAGPGPVAGR